MDTLATELHLMIVGYCSCIDDGSTIRALSAVSHYYRGLVLPRIYEVICINNDSTEKLRRVRRLADDLKRTITCSFSETTGVLHLAVNIDRFDGRLATTLTSVLELAAPTLQTLSFTIRKALRTDAVIELTKRLFSISFPELQDLIVFGPVPRMGPKYFCTVFPALKRGHFRVHRSLLCEIRSLIHVDRYKEIFPVIEKLRLSDFETPLDTRQMMHYMLILERLPHMSSVPFYFNSTNLPPTLQFLTMSPTLPLTCNVSHRSFLRTYGDSTRMQVNQTPTTALDFEWSNIRQKWLDGAQGRRGWW